MRAFFVYSIEHVASGRSYIGKAVDVGKRWSRHRRLASDPRLREERQRIHHALALYGLDAFSFKVESRHETEQEALNEESRLIAERCSIDDGFNVTPYGGGREHTIDARTKMRMAKLGKPLSLEHRAKLSEARRGVKRLRPMAEETRKKIGDANRGLRRSPERIEQMREETRARWAAMTPDERAAFVSKASKGPKKPRKPTTAEARENIRAARARDRATISESRKKYAAKLSLEERQTMTERARTALRQSQELRRLKALRLIED